jgi:hypothetical protein
MLRQIELANFSKAEADSIVVHRYWPGSDFTRITDSFTTKAWQGNYDDSLNYYFNLNDNTSNNPYNDDILLFFPATNTTYKVTGITTIQNVCKRCGGKTVYGTETKSYAVNGTIYQTSGSERILVTK